MWGICREEINIFPTSRQELSYIVPSPTYYPHIPHGVSFDRTWVGCGEDIAKKWILTNIEHHNTGSLWGKRLVGTILRECLPYLINIRIISKLAKVTCHFILPCSKNAFQGFSEFQQKKKLVKTQSLLLASLI